MSDEDTKSSSAVITGCLNGFTSNALPIPEPTNQHIFKKQRFRTSWFGGFPNIMGHVTTTGFEGKTLYSTCLLTSSNRFIHEKTIR